MKHIATKIWCSIASVVALVWGIMSTAQNSAARAEATGSLKIVVWYMVLQSVLFVLLSVAALLRITANQKTKGFQKGLYLAAAVIAAVYSLLLAFNIAPQLSAVVTADFWKQSGIVMVFFERSLYLLQGILLAVLSIDMLRMKLKRRCELVWISAVCVALQLIPYGFQFFGVGLQLVLTLGAGAILTALTVCQASVVYAAFIPMEK